MKTGKTLVELAQEIERQSASKKDYIAPVEHLSAVAAPDGQLQMLLDGVQSYPMTTHAHGQMASYLEIPKRYYDRMLTEAPDLLSESINRWLIDHAKEQRMVRTLDGKMRALLSDRYRPLENNDLAEAILPPLLELGVQVMSADITERRLYIKAVDQSIEKDVPTGRKMGDGSHCIFDTVCPAITVANSEIGAGALVIETSIFTRACTNLATFGTSLRKYHAGARAELSDEVYALLTDKTKEATNQALWMQARDLVRAAFNEAQFEAQCRKLGDAAQDTIQTGVIEVIERATKRFSWSQTEGESVLTNLIKGGDLTRYGLHAAVTRSAEDLSDYDRATEFEKLGGQIIELSPRDWTEISKAA